MKKKSELFECNVATTISLIGSKWKLLIIRNLNVRPWRFNELQNNLEGISQKVLTESLGSMIKDGIVLRTNYHEIPPRIDYSLTELGKSLKHLLDEMEKFGLEYKKRV